MNALEIEGLRKCYPGFTLQDVSFTLRQGTIMGLIGKNGAGKTTILKSILNLIPTDGGRVEILGMPSPERELECKAKLGVVLGGVDFYRDKKLSAITDVTKRFYSNWDEVAYRRYMEEFSVDPDKRVKELSAGMKVKYLIALALSHHAELFLFDEPTSGLDPVSRDELLTLFRALTADGSRSILYSTHITSDLEKCADTITYIKEGRLLASGEKEDFIRSFDHLREPGEAALTLEDIMVRTERREFHV
ncbi:MAG: ABC transporter ATP-binding protein [Oscillospiraceae bacterium]|nr:ABC transporter ATP-binding protein [Oscillospiraceae bacterium]MBP3520792.1 ABC transporter ATP-binding protein [Oscillospiraceae bacterium]